MSSPIPAPTSSRTPAGRSRKIVAIIIILAIATASVIGSLFYFASSVSPVQATKNFSYQAQPSQNQGSTSLSVTDVNGGINVYTWTQTNILINGTVTARGLGASTNTIVLAESNAYGNIVFIAQFPNQQSFFDFQNYEVSINVYAPASIVFDQVVIQTINGGISVQSISANNVGMTTINGAMTLSTINAQNLGLIGTNGDITFHCGICGNATATTTNGSVTGTFASPLVSGSYQLKTTNGSVNVRVQATSSFKLDAKTTNGNIGTTGLTLTNVTNISNHLTATVGGGTATMVISTVNGSVNVTGTA